MAKQKTIEDIYKKLEPREQILLRPDTQIGSIEIETKNLQIANYIDEKINIEKKEVKFIPGFIKIFDEILTNASDHKQRGGGVKTIKVNIENKNNQIVISVYNDGDGIPVVIHKEHNIYLPELLLGHVFSSSNYDDSEERLTGGRNGVGGSLANIFSTEFIVECADKKNKYKQIFKDNMSITGKPIIEKSKESFTKVTYKPDLTRLNVLHIYEDVYSIMLKRTLDIAAYNPDIKIYFNEKLIPINSLTDYAKMHIGNEQELFYEKLNDRQEIVIAESSNDMFEQVSIVNGISTYREGTHINYIVNKLSNELLEQILKGNKKIKLRIQDIKNKLFIFLICKIPNPSFDTQTKEYLSTKMTKEITQDCEISQQTIKKIMKSHIVESILEQVQLKEQQELNKLNKKAAGKTIRVEKLVDAHKAGTNESQMCSLAIAEGDSAKNSILAGLSVVGRDYQGVFPIKGRPLNVRDVAVSKITSNDEINKIIQIIGLVPGKKYTSLNELRYGKIIFFTDADLFGISIKGLLINFIHKMWPELLTLGFCYEFITPIVIAKKGKEKIEYYNLDKYYDDVKNTNKLNGFNIKYYKGLGTIVAEEIKDMFKNIKKHLIPFKYIHERDNDKIDMLFNEKRVSERKEQLLNYKGEIIPDKFNKPNQINDFIDNEFIQFSNYDNISNIPSMIDGLKPSQRKILYAGIKKNLKDEIKVAQFGAYVAEQTHYNHGEDSLSKAIVGMSQDFYGSNNINLFMPIGQFGTLTNPKSAASPRYIFTKLNNLTKLIYKDDDNDILINKYEDNDKIEPEFYLPIIPTILVNGTSGIGTGQSTDIPKYNPLSLIKVIKKKLEKPDIRYKIYPNYKGFDGDIEYNEEKNNYITKAVYQKTKKGILITQLPIEIQTENYITFLDKLCDDKVIKNYIDNSTDNTIKIEIIYDNIPDLELEKKLKLTSSLSLNNMHVFFNNEIKKYNSAEELLNDWFDFRYGFYLKRKESVLLKLEEQYNKLYYTLCFLKAVIDNTILINNRKKDLIINDLIEYEFPKINDSYDYLLNLPVYYFTKEKYTEYKENAKSKKLELTEYKKLEIKDIQINDLTELENILKKLGY